MRTIKRLWLLQVLSLAGVAISLYIYVFSLSNNFFCPVGDCATVTSSPFSYIGSVPVSLFGFMYYMLLLFIFQILRWRSNPLLLKAVGAFCVIGLLYSIFLMFVQVVYIQAVCFWCVCSFIFITLINMIYGRGVFDFKRFTKSFN